MDGSANDSLYDVGESSPGLLIRLDLVLPKHLAGAVDALSGVCKAHPTVLFLNRTVGECYKQRECLPQR